MVRLRSDIGDETLPETNGRVFLGNNIEKP